jgi:hypothetical protein
MKKFLPIALLTLFAVILVVSCGPKAAAPKAGSAKADDMLSLLPKDSRGVLVVDVHRIMQTEAVTKALQKEENAKKYQEFIQTTGIDPQKDVFFFVGAMAGDLTQKTEEGAAVVNLKYNKDKLLAMLQKERGELTKTDYNGLTVYQAAATEGKKPVSGAFLDDSNILVGSDAAVKKIIDVYQKKTESIRKNEEMTTLLKGMNTSAMVWGGVSIPPEVMKQATSQNPMAGAFADIRSLLLSFDHKDNNLLLEIKGMCPDAEKNKQMAAALNGFKALGAGVASKEPLVGELLNKIEISSANDHVKISANIPDALIESLSEKAKVKKAEQ